MDWIKVEKSDGLMAYYNPKFYEQNRRTGEVVEKNPDDRSLEERLNEMVNANKFVGTYLSSEDVDSSQRKNYTISDVREEDIRGDTKLVVDFEEVEKPLALNSTNNKKIQEVTGTAETDEWIGQEIQLTTVEVNFQGEMVKGIRVTD